MDMSLILRKTNPLFNSMNDFSDFEDWWRPFAVSSLDEKSMNKNNEKQWIPLVDIAENEKEILLHMDVPGVKKEDMKIDFHDGILSISGERKSFKESSDDNFFRSERKFGNFKRSFKLDTAIDDEQIFAQINDGELQIKLTKAMEKNKKRIEIQ